MRADAAEADRRQVVREAAARWQATGAIDGATRGRIDALFPDDRHRLSPSFRGLLGLFTFFGVHALFGLVVLFDVVSGHEAGGTLMVLYGAALAVATEWQLGPLRRRDAGTETATALCALLYLVGGMAVATGGDSPTFTLTVASVLLAAAAWHWGFPFAAAVSAGCFLFLLARVPGGRALWVLAGLGAFPLFAAGGSAGLPPSLRASLRAAALILVAGAYAALHVGSWDAGVIESIAAGAAHDARPPAMLRPLAIVATALLPLAVVLAGVVRRDPQVIRAGALLILVSAVTLRFYVHVAPLWTVLIGSGGAAILVVLVLRRWLHAGPDRERGGFTAEPLFEDEERRSLIEVAAKAAVFTPEAAEAPPDRFRPGGGQYGGGGASGSY